MLRRKPTALTISPEDLQAFEQDHATFREQQEYLRAARKKMMTSASANEITAEQRYTLSDQQMQYMLLQQQNEKRRKLSLQKQQQQQEAAADQADQAVDPNDELKPLPGDKARIVRSREERIIGVGSSNSASGPRTTAGSGAAAGHHGHGPARM